MLRKRLDKTLYSYLDMIQRVAQKFEDDLIASRRFKYLRTEGDRKIYVELATGREVPVLKPRLGLAEPCE